ncbi:MAG: hypothetical protein ACR5LF_13710 [Symbiopectobacterium sp.]
MNRYFDESLLKRSAHATETGDPLVEFRGYGRRNMVDLFDLSVAPGEIVGLVGLLGSDRTETAQLVFGIKTPDSGEARVDGQSGSIRSPVDGQSGSIRSPHKAGKLGFGYCPEDRKT